MTKISVAGIKDKLKELGRREGVTMTELLELFPDDYHAEAWFCWVRWGDSVRCVDCGSGNIRISGHRQMRFRCRDCLGFFSVKKGTVMESSKLGLQKWIIAIYAAVTNLRGISSTKLARDIGVTQKTAWHMMHRIREALDVKNLELLSGINEIRRPAHAAQTPHVQRPHRRIAQTGVRLIPRTFYN